MLQKEIWEEVRERESREGGEGEEREEREETSEGGGKDLRYVCLPTHYPKRELQRIPIITPLELVHEQDSSKQAQYTGAPLLVQVA